jgi:hypothetical protein
MEGMDEAVQRYVDQIAGEHRALFDRVNGLILGAYPDAVVKLSYTMPSYWRGRRKLYVGCGSTGCRCTGGRKGPRPISRPGTRG